MNGLLGQIVIRLCNEKASSQVLQLVLRNKSVLGIDQSSNRSHTISQSFASTHLPYENTSSRSHLPVSRFSCTAAGASTKPQETSQHVGSFTGLLALQLVSCGFTALLQCMRVPGPSDLHMPPFSLPKPGTSCKDARLIFRTQVWEDSSKKLWNQPPTVYNPHLVSHQNIPFLNLHPPFLIPPPPSMEGNLWHRASLLQYFFFLLSSCKL